MFELAFGVRTRAAAVQFGRSGRALVQMSTTAATTEGAEIELAYHLGLVADAGRIRRLEFFALDDIDGALAWLGASSQTELAGADDGLRNAAVRHMAHLIALFAERNWGGFAAGMSDVAVGDDRRAVVGLRYE